MSKQYVNNNVFFILSHKILKCFYYLDIDSVFSVKVSPTSFTAAGSKALTKMLATTFFGLVMPSPGRTTKIK